MEYLFHAFASQLQVSISSLLGLLDECVQHHSALADEKTIERPPDARFASWPELK
jgi:hypothetical protein